MCLRNILNLIIIAVLMNSCNNHEDWQAQNNARIQDSVIVDGVQTVSEAMRDSFVVDDDFVFGFVDKVKFASLNLLPDSNVLVNNLHSGGVMDTMRFVSSAGFKAVLYHVAYDKRHILWEAEIDFASELGILLWKDINSRHTWPSEVNPLFMDFEATNEVRLIRNADGSGRFVYCLLHRE